MTELQRITLKGFKATRDGIGVDIRPLTLLAGQNSAGKSTIVQPLLLMKQTLEATHDPGVLELNGPCVRFNETSQLLWRGRSGTDVARSWEIELGLADAAVRVEYRLQKGGFGVASTRRTQGSGELKLHAGMSEDEKRKAMTSAGMSKLPEGYRLEVRAEALAAAASALPGKQGHEVDKDVHLVALAMCTDRRVLSLDEAQRALLVRLAARVKGLDGLHWANPCGDDVVAWLAAEAPDAGELRIGPR